MAKIIITIVLLVVVVAAVVIGTRWRELLSAEQKLNYGMVFDATEDYAKAAQQNPTDQLVLYDYVDVLTRKGNLGRAYYISQLYGVEHEGLDGLRNAVVASMEAATRGDVYAMRNDAAVMRYADDPVRQTMRYLEGYQYALLGDWMSAKNYFNAIDEKHLAPELQMHHQYYLGRSYRLAGDEAEQAQVVELLQGVMDSRDRSLAPKAAYNLVAWYLSMDGQNDDWPQKYAAASEVLNSVPSVWAEQKIAIEIGRFALADNSVERAWSEAAKALNLGTKEATGKSLCQFAIDTLVLAKADPASSECLARGYRPGCLVELASGCARFEMADRLALELSGMEPLSGSVAVDQTKIKQYKNELLVANAIAARANGDTALLAALIGGSTFSDRPSSIRADVYFQYASLLENKERWNDALSYYRKVVDLGGDDAADAQFRRYAVIKQVQNPLNLTAAVDVLTAITTDHKKSDVYPKAVEELLPLLIYNRQRGTAIDLIDEVMKDYLVSSTISATTDQLYEVALYWKAYLMEQQGDSAFANMLRKDMPLRYWNYYELTSNYPPDPQLSNVPGLLELPENAGEYLAGLGLTDSARDFFNTNGDDSNQLLVFYELANGEVLKSMPIRQWDATGLLESGVVKEQPLVDFVLAEAYPMPFADEIGVGATQSGVDRALIYAVIKKETNFRPESVSWVGAQGLMQLMPNTASWLNNRYSLGLDLGKVMEPKTNIKLGAAYLRSLQDDLGEYNIRAVIHTYNGGPGNYQGWRSRYQVDQILFTDLVPNEQNETYTKKVIKYYKIYDWLLSADH